MVVFVMHVCWAQIFSFKMLPFVASVCGHSRMVSGQDTYCGLAKPVEVKVRTQDTTTSLPPHIPSHPTLTGVGVLLLAADSDWRADSHRDRAEL